MIMVNIVLQSIIRLLSIVINSSSSKINGNLLISIISLFILFLLNFFQFLSLLFTNPFITRIVIIRSIIDHLCSLRTRRKQKNIFMWGLLSNLVRSYSISLSLNATACAISFNDNWEDCSFVPTRFCPSCSRNCRASNSRSNFRPSFVPEIIVSRSSRVQT